MRVIRTVLQHVSDDLILGKQTLWDGPLAELVIKFNSAALAAGLNQRFGFTEVTPDTLGRDFKFYMAQLPPESKMQLLEGYLERHGAPPLVLRPPNSLPTEDEDLTLAQEERRLKHWMLKIRAYGAVVLVVLFFLILGAMIVLMVQDHKLPDNAIFGTLLSTATEIVKVLFNSK